MRVWSGIGIREERGTSVASTETKDEVEGGLLLDVVVGQSTSIFQLLSGEDQSLLVWGNSLLILDLGFHVLNGVGGLDLKGDGLAGQCLDEDLHLAVRLAAKHNNLYNIK